MDSFWYQLLFFGGVMSLVYHWIRRDPKKRVDGSSQEPVIYPEQSLKGNNAKTDYEDSAIQEDKNTEIHPPNSLAVAERKGSNDSLTSQKSVESQRSSDSQSSVPTRETFHKKAKRQLQAFIGVGKKPEKWEGGVTPIVHSDSEMDESNQPVTRSTLPDISNTRQNRLSMNDSPITEEVWHKRSNFPMEQPEITVPKPSITRSQRVSQQMSGDTPKDGRRLLKRELRTMLPDTNIVNLDQKTRSPLKASISHDERSMSKPSMDPEIPVRIARRVRAPRELVCRSVGEEMTDSMTGDIGSNAGLLGTIKEMNIVVPDSGRPGDTRSLWASRKEPQTSEGGENSFSGTFSSQESEWSPVPPHLDNVYLKSGITIHGIPTKRNRSGAITSLHLKRRNSDPATKSMNLIMDQPMGGESPHTKPSDILEWKSAQVFTIAGHHFRKVTRVSKEDQCISCKSNVDAFAEQGYKCTDCKQLFHTKCIQNGGVLQLPCSQQLQSSGKPRRQKHRKHSRTPYDMSKPTVGGKFNLTGTSEFTDSTDKIISDASELQQMQDFITQKIYKMESEEGKKPSEVDRVFKQALREFKDNLVSTYSVINKQGETFNIKYKDLIANFLHVMETVCNQEDTKEAFPVTMGVNAFRGFMNEFMNMNRLEEKPQKVKRKKEKKRKTEDPIIFSGHTFLFSMINIPTACEVCSSFFMWPIEKSLICQNCKLTCHKKCYIRVTTPCGKDNITGGNRVFGVPLHLLAVGDGKVPVVVDRLITTIEMYGLYTEGLYRKSGVTSKVKELKTRIEEGNTDEVNFENYHVHVLAAVLKSFYREMPEPLLTFDSYEDFLRAASLTDPQDRISTLFAILKKIPKPNFDLMERLIFHLARVALHEDANRMNAGALAIVFAPCILRTNKIVPAQDSLHDIGRQTQCVETIITEKLRKVKATLADIDTLDTACHTATHRLSSLRSSKIFSPEELLPPELANSDAKPALLNPDDEEALLVGHIQEIQKEKALLTSALPSLTRTTSDDDLLSTDMDDGSLDDVTGRLDDTEQDAQQYPVQLRKGKVHRTLAMRSVSGGDEPNGEEMGCINKRKIKRQSSSDNSVVSLYPPLEDEDPIMV